MRDVRIYPAGEVWRCMEGCPHFQHSDTTVHDFCLKAEQEVDWGQELPAWCPLEKKEAAPVAINPFLNDAVVKQLKIIHDAVSAECPDKLLIGTVPTEPKKEADDASDG